MTLVSAPCNEEPCAALLSVHIWARNCVTQAIHVSYPHLTLFCLTLGSE